MCDLIPQVKQLTWGIFFCLKNPPFTKNDFLYIIYKRKKDYE